MVTSMGLYALLVLTVYGASLAQTAWGFNILQMAGGLLWVVIIFTSLLGLLIVLSRRRRSLLPRWHPVGANGPQRDLPGQDEC